MTTRRRRYGDGSLRRRGKNSWLITLRTVDAKTNKKIRRFYTVKGTAAEARERLADLSKAARTGALRDENTPFNAVLAAWDSSLNVSLKTAERYRELVASYIRPHLGEIKLSALRPSRLDQFYIDLRAGRKPDGSMGARTLAPRTIHHAHRLVVQALSLAERDGLIASNPARNAKRPKVERREVEILDPDQVKDVLGKLRGHKMYRIAALGLGTGLRRGELCGLRWSDLNLDAATLRVEQSLEQTKPTAGQVGPQLRFKEPKTKTSRRTIAVPASIVRELRVLRREQNEQRLRLGLGKEPDDALVFRKPDGSPLVPNSLTTEWRRLVKELGLPKVSMHAWRHTHASQLIDSGMDVLTISRRLGHASPSITLDVYGHRFTRKDETAAAVFDAAFSSVLSE